MLIIQFHTLSLWKNASHTNFIHFCKMSLIEFQRYFIVVLVSKLVSLHKKKEKKWYEKKMLIIQFPYMEIVWLAFFYKKIFVKKSFEQSIQQLAKHLSVFWAATTENFEYFLFLFSEKKNTSHTISIYGNCMTSNFLMATTKIFQSIFENCPQQLFCVFFSIANWFSYSNKHFLKKNFCMQNLFFLCV